jgi:hypothetical protein
LSKGILGPLPANPLAQSHLVSIQLIQQPWGRFYAQVILALGMSTEENQEQVN